MHTPHPHTVGHRRASLRLCGRDVTAAMHTARSATLQPVRVRVRDVHCAYDTKERLATASMRKRTKY